MEADYAAILRSASLKIILGDLPPSSRDTFFKLVYAESVKIILPTGVEPVKAIFQISICLEMADPADGPFPLIIQMTPGGKISLIIYAKYKALNGVFSLGLIIITLPQAREGAHFQPINIKG